ncbi:cilia- and flagella-associated protein 263-like isoform X2 [Hoplias malabaricus]|uniref:cilia- and flagella-associated protein 263-like isoform X2 n=1 Tax=Hoplias malabaricus TaxID=27720 RepID=UPI003461D498
MAAMEGSNGSEADQKRIVELVQDLRSSNSALQAENEIFERFISRLDPRDVVSHVVPESVGVVSSMEMVGRRRTFKQHSQERSQCLTLEQKCDIAQRVLEEMRDELKQFRETSERVVHNYKATIEEADIRLTEVKKASYEFERDIAKNLKKKQGWMMAGEKDTLIEKLREKNSALRVQKRKLQLQLQQKEEMGEAVHDVDFQQLKIENSQYLERIDERNQDLLRLKLLNAKTLQTLNSYKKRLQNLTLESKSLSSDISSCKMMMGKIEEEAWQAEEERVKAEAVNQKLRAQLGDFHVPNVLDYVATEASHTKLVQSVRAWERKVEIAEMALKTHTKAWNKLRATAGAVTVTHNISN